MLLDSILSRLIRCGTLKIRYPDGTSRSFNGSQPGPSAALALTNHEITRRLVWNPSLGFGEGYMDGSVEPIDGSTIHDVLDVLLLNMASGGSHPAMKINEGFRWAGRRLLDLNTARRSRRNVAHHYDLNGTLYSLFLDADRQYSCAYFPTGKETLEEAQALKKRHLASKLKLDRPDLEVLDIGSGWGGLAITLARDYGARVTGLTLSEEQVTESRARAEAAGLSDRVHFELMDYRSWARPMDRIVSVGMFEHVGINHYTSFFRTVKGALKEDGVALIHAIGQSEGPATTNPWITKYIFPGGYSPALSEVVPAAEKAGLWITDIEILRLHYAMTIAHWRDRFAANRNAIKSLYDERFCRMFEFYLSASELSFRRWGHMNWQLQLTRNVDALPLTRDYMFDAERASTYPHDPPPSTEPGDQVSRDVERAGG
ncbi:class I SAM-dependent methyltransferase [Roseomonas xinghualingensis]|uniref:class I SAM-dependent methyltransferase n=1 Tax=Roseomonas xinghualingensis TaxID=2986475 RepID=UPI0021F15B4A|nr:cyclopropane-fatty-acyl-phospholipid synthase family protein [Roseomonas sp. SXEYE001]MCV4206561.1 cyclopropane-fatty-acyl-phospholipid synthase family protein [Roseomonas sp. SXEYE001]